MREGITLEISQLEHDAFVRELDAKFARINDENERQNHRLAAIEDNLRQLQVLTTSVEKMGVSIESMVNELKKQGERLDAIEKEPADKWKKAVWIVISAVIGFALALIASRIGAVV